VVTERPHERLVVRLSAVPRPVIFVLVLVLTVGALLLDGVLSAALVGVLIVLVASLSAVSWRTAEPSTRLLRLLVIGALVAVAVSKLL
jgi:hypothetical protein